MHVITPPYCGFPCSSLYRHHHYRITLQYSDLTQAQLAAEAQAPLVHSQAVSSPPPPFSTSLAAFSPTCNLVSSLTPHEGPHNVFKSALPAQETPAWQPGHVISQPQFQYADMKPVCTPPKYDGTTELVVFLNKFDMACALNGWCDTKIKLLWLCSCLEGEASKLQDEQFSNFELMEAALERSFGVRAKRRAFERTLSVRRRKRDEDLVAIAADIRRMVRVVYAADLTGTQERMLVKHFSSALSNVDIEWELAKAGVTTLDQAVQLAVEREAFFGPETSSNIRAIGTNVTDSSDLAEQLKSLQEAVSKLTVRNETSGGRRKVQEGTGRYVGVADIVVDPIPVTNVTNVTHVTTVGAPITTISVPLGLSTRTNQLFIALRIPIHTRKTLSVFLSRANRTHPPPTARPSYQFIRDSYPSYQTKTV